jgi:hypothetical protein
MSDTDAPERIYVLRSDAEMLSNLESGRADMVFAGPKPLHNMHGEPSTIEYLRLPPELVERIRELLVPIGHPRRIEHPEEWAAPAARALRDILSAIGESDE